MSIYIFSVYVHVSVEVRGQLEQSIVYFPGLKLRSSDVATS